MTEKNTEQIITDWESITVIYLEIKKKLPSYAI